ncbi:hypothetical protein NQ317_017028 [Molorchus minor]|uniref:Uncharacterized protein n=1 Tax=Molorchus minor TaxID=1323400 RepID=A0ABQ9IVZ7_9CUCU|nr:hypothetical protein NQ317_017028 [Molorchus minor]
MANTFYKKFKLKYLKTAELNVYKFNVKLNVDINTVYNQGKGSFALVENIGVPRIDDHRLSRPFSLKPPIKFGTIPWSHTDSTLSKYFKEMHAYMRQHNRSTVLKGVADVLSGGTRRDEDCRLLTVGSWYAMTGYGLAFPEIPNT